jgi:phenylpropionate dioxygenase-like ring-hydroxylating dioxygenase large terminal subunit
MSAVPFRLSADNARDLHRQVDAGFLLPTQWYGDAAIFDAEIERIHRRSWHFAAHLGQLQEPGEVALCTIAKAPVVLVRQSDGGVKGFLNICRHRGHPVVMEEGARNAIRCHFHGWTYELDGRLRHAPRSKGDATFDPACFGLVPVQTHVWGPTVWVNIDRQAPSFETWIEGMPELVAQHGLDVTQHSYAFGHTWEINANWKVFQDNTIECYHCPTTHPELCLALEMKPELQEMWVGGRHWIHHRIPFRPGLTEGLTYKKPADGTLYYYYHWIFPGTYMQFSGKGFDIGSLDMIAVDKIRFTHICFLPHDTSDEIRAKGQRIIEADPTIRQDVDICNRVQVGHASGLAPQARVFATPERLLSHFQHLIVDMMTDPPAGGLHAEDAARRPIAANA